ncbi:MAG: GDSL-type esterase/lipase family protein [Balneolaceae bacterium]|nr:GDSL-type esterase/lipase family protein [Balneolaceae bacterium]
MQEKTFLFYIVRLLPIFLFTSVSVNAQPVSDPDPARFQQQIEAFEQWDARNSFPENGVLFTGSSSIRFWKTHRSFPDLSVINRGFGGAHISDVLHYYDEVIGKYQPSVIVFYAGDNDIAAGKPVSQVIEDYREITDRIRTDFPGTRFLFISIKPSSSRWSYWTDMKRTNILIREYNNQHGNLYYIDLAAPLLQNGKPDERLFMDDLLHLNERGYAAWNRVIGPKLEALFE